MSFKSTRSRGFIIIICVLALVGATRAMMTDQNEPKSSKSDSGYQVLKKTRLKKRNFELFYLTMTITDKQQIIRFSQVYYHSNDQIYKRQMELRVDELKMGAIKLFDIIVYHDLGGNNLEFVKNMKIKRKGKMMIQTNVDDDDHKELNIHKLPWFYAGNAFKLSIKSYQNSELVLILSQRNELDKVTLYIKNTEESAEEKKSEGKKKV